MSRRKLFAGVIVVLVFAMAFVCVPAVKAQPGASQAQEVRPFPTVNSATLQSMDAPALENLGDELRTRKEYLQAIDCYNESLKKQKSAVVYNKIGMAYISMLQPDKAKESLQKAIKLDKKYPEAYNNLGVVFYIKKDYGKAIKQYRRALSLREDSASFHSNLGTAYLQKKEMERGAEEYRRAYELDPMVFERSSTTGISARMSSPEDHAQFCYVMARIYASKGDNEHALQWLRRAMEDGYKEIGNVYKENEFAKLREDQRFTELMQARPPALQ